MGALKKRYDEEDEEGDSHFYLEMLLAVTDFPQFIQMMQHYKRDQKKKWGPSVDRLKALRGNMS